MPTAVLTPDGDGILLQLTATGGGTHWDQVDEGIAGSDDGTTTLSTTNNSDQDDMLTLIDVPGDFVDANSFLLVGRSQLAGVVDDICSPLLRVYESGEVDPGDRVGSVGGGPGTNHTWAANTPNGGGVDTANAATWNTRKVNMHWARSNTGMPDSILGEYTSVEVLIDYNAASTPSFPDRIAGNLKQAVRRAMRRAA